MARMNTTTQAQRIARAHYSQYLESTNTDLFDVYGHFSKNKVIALNRCEALMNELGGHSLRILSANSQTFTVGFEYPNEETGELMFAYITKDYDRACLL